MAWVRARLCKLQKKGAFDSQPQVIKFTSCLPMAGGSLASSTTKTSRHDIDEISLKVALNQSIKPVACREGGILNTVIRCNLLTAYKFTEMWNKCP
jgi:hypothetical protein